MCQASIQGTFDAPIAFPRRLGSVAAAGRPGRRAFRRSRVEIQDQKAVVATVEPVHQLVARARLGGTIVSLKAKEGDRADAGAELATVADPKLLLQMQALDSRIQSQQSQADKAKTDLDRAEELQRRGVSTQVQVDAAKTAFDVAERTLDAMRSDRGVIAQQMSEGAVLAPAAGRVLTVPVSEGRVVLPGETIATLAEDRYILRLQLPERHAQFMRAGDKVLIGSRGLGEGPDENRREGRVRIVYPEIQGGRVIADVDVEGLGDYFVGERTRVYVNTGARRAIVIPRSLCLSSRRRQLRENRRWRGSGGAARRRARRRR